MKYKGGIIVSKHIEIRYEDKETITLSEVINDMVDNGLAAANLEGGGVTFTMPIILIAGKKE